uniref:NIDO domain-containing protein n=1 Tax=Fundulus heteroclitus TaxID=8078 RepID=A0A3Q2UKP7_FUNHE
LKLFNILSFYNYVRTLGIFYHYFTCCPIFTSEMNKTLDGSSPKIILQRPFAYFGKQYDQIYVNHNGHMTFNDPSSMYIPQRFPMYATYDIIAPFWTDFDNRLTGLVYYKQYTNGIILNQATQDINKYFPQFTFSASWVFVATWHEIPYWQHYNAVGLLLQAVLISGGQYSFVLMNYGNISPTSGNVQVRTMYFVIPGWIRHN